MEHCCVCGLDLSGLDRPETFQMDEDEIAELYDREVLPDWQLKWMGERICGINEISFRITESEATGYICLYSFTALSGEEVTIRHCRPRSGYLPDITEPETPFQVHLRCLSLIERVLKRDPSFSPPPEQNPSLASIQHFYHIMGRLRPFIYEPWDSIQGLGIRWKHGYYRAFHSGSTNNTQSVDGNFYGRTHSTSRT